MLELFSTLHVFSNAPHTLLAAAAASDPCGPLAALVYGAAGAAYHAALVARLAARRAAGFEVED